MQTEQKIIEKLKKLPPRYLDGVLSYIDSILEQLQEQLDTFSGDDESRPIPGSNGRYKGEELIKRLHESRQRLSA